jgi:hypothetical protein
MASPLGLTESIRQKIQYTSDTGGNPSESSFTGQYNSIFNGSKFYYRPTIGTSKEDQNKDISTENETITNKVDNEKGSKRHQTDNFDDDLYDISTNSIINYTNDDRLKSMRLKPSDFAYLRDFGVYPNNRLIITRRFPSPVDNDLTDTSLSPLSTVVSWIPDNQESFFSFEVDERWRTGDESNDPLQSLADLFNKIFLNASGTNPDKGLEGLTSGLSKFLPLGGLGESIQQEIVNSLLGEEDENGNFQSGSNFNAQNLFKGNPNALAQAAYREPNSISSTIQFTVNSVYEMKFINGVDPTIVFMDVIQNLLRFSGSQSVFFISQAGGGKINKFFNKFQDGKWVEAIKIVLDSVIDAVSNLVEDVGDKFIKTLTGGDEENDPEEPKEESEEDQAEDAIDSLGSDIQNALSTISRSSLAKYRIEFAKIIPQSTGASSAPWHVTVGNPKNPFFSSGDMVCKNTKITFGNTLGFNDLPTRIEVNFTIQSARNLGIQEIFDKFNIGAGRQYQKNSIKFKTDFYQGEVGRTDAGENSTNNPITGAPNRSESPQ